MSRKMKKKNVEEGKEREEGVVEEQNHKNRMQKRRYNYVVP